MNVNRKSFITFYQFVMSVAKDELTIELTIVDCSLRPKKLFHVVIPFSDVISFLIQSCLTFLLDVNSFVSTFQLQKLTVI